MVQNLSIFDCELSGEDMAKIAAMDKKTSSFFDQCDPATVEFFLRLIQERRNRK